MKYKTYFMIDKKGNKIWFRYHSYDNGTIARDTIFYHCESGPAVIKTNGTKEWWFNGMKHRNCGPAVIKDDGTKEWWFNGKLHREDGPAVIYANNSKEWWLNGKQLPTKEVEEWLEKNKINLSTIRGQMAFKIVWN